MNKRELQKQLDWKRQYLTITQALIVGEPNNTELTRIAIRTKQEIDRIMIALGKVYNVQN